MMAVAGGAHTRFVTMAKIVLPLVALALFATMFLIARRIDPYERPPDPDIIGAASEARIGSPEFSGVTADGTVVSLAAEVARPDQSHPGRMTAQSVDARFEIPGGSTVEATSGSAAVDSAARQVDLTGDVVFTTSTGYRVESPGLTAELGVARIETTGAVTADGPPGRLEAGLATITQDPDDPSAYVLVFNGGVRLVYEPGD